MKFNILYHHIDHDVIIVRFGCQFFLQHVIIVFHFVLFYFMLIGSVNSIHI